MTKHLWVVVLLSATGCAFTNVPISLSTSPSAGLSGGDRRQIVVVTPATDQRPQRDKCGVQKNSYNQATAKALCSMEPTAWLTQTLEAELKVAGFDVVAESSAKASALRVDSALLQIFVEPIIGFSTITLDTDIHIKVVATSKTGLVAERSFYVKGVESGMVARAGNFQTSATRATQQVMKDMVAAIISLMNRYPQLGQLERLPQRDSASTRG